MRKVSIPGVYAKFKHRIGSELDFIEFIKTLPVRLKIEISEKTKNVPILRIKEALRSPKNQGKFLKYLKLELNNKWGGDEFKIGPYPANVYFYDLSDLTSYFNLNDFYKISDHEGTKIGDYIKDVGNSGFKHFSVYVPDEIMIKEFIFRSIGKANMLKFLVEQFDDNPDASFEIKALLERFGIKRGFEDNRGPQIRDLLDNNYLSKYFIQRNKSVFFNHPSSW